MTDVQAWVRELEAVYAETARTRMAGLPIVHPALRVQAVGFVDHGSALVGVLITPWFMSVVRHTPGLRAEAQPSRGQVRTHAIGTRYLDFMLHQDARLGPFEACSLFSPMFQFADQAAAVATAEAVMAELLPDRAMAPSTSQVRPAGDGAAAAPPRRRFLLGGLSGRRS